MLRQIESTAPILDAPRDIGGTVDPFVYQGAAARVIFGFGTVAQLPAEADRLGLKRVLVLATPQQHDQGERTAAALGARAAGVFAQAAMHTPVEVSERAMQVLAGKQVDGVVAIGGGSTTGLAKAIALRTDLPQIIVPTTYAGSEMTPILGETKAGVKTTLRSEKVLPETVIYDVDFTMTLPAGLTATSGINAIAHAVEALYAKNRNPVISLMAEEGIRALATALPHLRDAPGDRDARSDALYGAWLCGTCLGAVDMALHHKLCHTLGGTFNLPHAETHTVVLPHATAYNAAAAPDAMARIAHGLGEASAPLGLHQLAKRLGAPTALKDLGMPEDGIGRAVELALASPYPNPVPLEADGIRALLTRAWRGDPPAAG